MNLKVESIRAELDGCLCTHLELLPAASPSALCSTHLAPLPDPTVDPFAAWPPVAELLHDSGDVDSEDKRTNHGHSLLHEDGDCTHAGGEDCRADVDDEVSAAAREGAAASGTSGANDAVRTNRMLDVCWSGCRWLLRPGCTRLPLTSDTLFW